MVAASLLARKSICIPQQLAIRSARIHRTTQTTISTSHGRKGSNHDGITFHQRTLQLVEDAKLGKFLRSTKNILPQPASSMTTKTNSKTVTLLHPPGACSAFTRSGSLYPPLGLNQLCAVIGDTSRVHVLEADGNLWSNEETEDRILSNAPLAVGMIVTCGTKSLVHAWSTVVKNLHPVFHPLVIVGGPAAAFVTHSIFQKCPHVDVVVKGEGEVVFPHIVDILERHQGSSRSDTLKELSLLPGVVVRGHPNERNDGIINVVPKEAFTTLPFPDLSNSPV